MAYVRSSKHSRGGLDYQERRQLAAKKQREEDIEALCVVGYASKLFKDDSTAMAIHRGQYLVPWMGDTSMMIDRFDGRGHLSDLSEIDKVHSWNQVHHLSEEEARIEAICDEERYLALRTDLMEEETKREEELKRIHQSMGALRDQKYYGAVAPAYGEGGSNQSEEYDPTMPTEDEAEKAERLAKERVPTPEPEQPFMAPESLNLPSGIETPGTQKLNLIIERTASFIAKQNPQMEIVIKARQSKNPQFDFLNYDHYLNPYYRHIVKCIKEGKYVPAPIPKEPEKPAEDSDDSDGEGYLHPGLLGSSELPKPKLPSHPIRPTQTTAQAYAPVHQGYSTTQSSVPPSSHQAIHSAAPSLASQVADVAPPVTEPPSEPVPAVAPPADSTSGDTELLAAYYANAASEFVNAYLTALASSAPPPPPGSEGQLQQPGAVPASLSQIAPVTSELNLGVTPGVSTGLEGTETNQNPESVPPIIPPPPDVQPIIDKLAEFVAKNGDDFENGIKLKGDPRFDFVNTWHSFFTYYEQKKFMYRREMEEREAAALEAQKAPVSFSIKPRDIDERVLVGRSALPVEESDSDEELPKIRKPPIGSLDQAAGMTDLINLTKQQIALAMVEATLAKSDDPQTEGHHPLSEENKRLESQRPLWNHKEPSTTGPVSVDYNHGRPRPTPTPPSVPPPPRSRDFSSFLDSSSSLGGAPGRPGILESRRGAAIPPPKTTQPFVSREELARRQAEKAKLEDKLAKAAREKMAGISKERQLQMERRKKAALFMSRMKDQPEDSELDAAGERGNRQRRSSSRERDRERERERSSSSSSSSKATPRAYQTSFDIRVRKRSRSPSPAKRSSPPVSKSRSDSPILVDPLVPFKKKSSSRESSPGSSNGSSGRGILKHKDFHAGTLGGILLKKKPSLEDRKARIKKLVQSSKQSDEVIEID
ncbi:splicing factor, suppressor of white-apricot homolog isoform X1 [Apostichopus japonicus]|uniref:splicing factor, suppressor of white-apricot homolog isoform X1 n=2 Tax=Stichopus japonicus TaxID=307972 RepID=UPI003AB82F68